jgi:uncharacterized protein with FMN-binding domain
MKRVLLSICGTVLGLVALLSFKTHGQAVTGGALPSAGLPAASSSTPARSGQSTSAPPNPSPGSSTRTVTGTAVQTQYGIVQVQVKVSGTKIRNVSFVRLTAYDGYSQQINSEAGPILLRETLSAQSAHIDTVSGASYTSAGYVQSLQSALDKVGIR